MAGKEDCPRNVIEQSNFDVFLDQIEANSKDEVDNFLLSETGTAETADYDSQGDLSKQLVEALEENDVVEVWKLIASGNKNSKTLGSLNEVCTAIVARESKKEDVWKFICKECKELCKTLKDTICQAARCNEDVIENEKTEMRSEAEQNWIKILSNPLYISLKWLWRNNLKSQCNEGFRRKESKSVDVIESKSVDVIEAALNDAYLLEKIASYEHHYSREKYKQRAVEYEKFAADIVEQINPSELKKLHEIMDIKGEGCLLTMEPCNFNQSLSLLKMAADKNRKRVGIKLITISTILSDFVICILREYFADLVLETIQFHPFLQHTFFQRPQ